MSEQVERSFAQQLRWLADDDPDAVAVTFRGETTTYRTLVDDAEAFGRYLGKEGVGVGDMVTIALPNSVEFLRVMVACWFVGAIPQPVSSRLPGRELEQIVELADSSIVVGAQVEGRMCIAAGERLPSVESGWNELDPDVVSPHWKAPTSGGSTGRPKLIVSGDPALYQVSQQKLAAIIGAVRGECSVVPGPLYHNGPFIWSSLTLLAGGHVALMPRFDAEATLAEVEAFGATAIYLVPTMMQRIWKLSDETKFGYDVSTLRIAFHLAEPCPAWLKEAWIEWLGAEVIWELYGGTEGQMFTVIRGDEWMEHRGSVGRPIMGEVKICDDEGSEIPAGVEGEVWMRTTRDHATYLYIGAETESRDGWESLGDMGYVDVDGYLYLGDRKKDMILIGGANVYPAEIEAAIGAHPEVLSAAVIGLADEDKGSRIHAIVQRADGSELDTDDLMTFLADRLVTYKLPRSIEWSAEPLRDDAGKVRRSALQAERS